MTCLLPRGNKKLNKKMKTKKGPKKKINKRSKKGSKKTKIHKKNLSKKISTISSDTDKTCNDNTINCQKKELLKILRETKFPFNQSRKNVMKKGQLKYEGFVLGRINLHPYWAKQKGHKQELSVRTKDPKFKELYKNTRLLIDMHVKEHDPKFKYTTIQYNKNHKCAKHKDGRNVGVSYIIGLGDYTGGELIVFDENGKNQKKHDIRNKFYTFNGSKHFHVTAPFKGERYTMVFFNV